MGAPLTSSSGSQRRQDPTPEINVTPLVDVVLVLLIIFMVIAPALNEGEQLTLPEIFTPDPQPKDLHPIDVTIASADVVLVDGQRIETSALRSQVEALHKADPDRKLLLKADTGLPYHHVRDTFAILQGIGFRGISLKVVQKKDRS